MFVRVRHFKLQLPMDVRLQPWVTNARSGGNLHEPRADGGRADQPRRTGLRYLFAAAEGAHHLPPRSDRGWHVDADGRATAVSRSRKTKKRKSRCTSPRRVAW